MKKTKNLLIVVLSLLMLVSLSLFAFACKDDKEPTSLTIDSATEVTIEVGQTYTLLYSCSGTVTVTVNGGTYDESTHKYTAEEIGEYVMTVTGIEDGKAETTATVSIKVVAGADKSAINTALKKIEGLISGDYTTTSWAALNSAKNDANEVLNSYGVTAEQVTAAANEIEAKINALVPAEIAKVVINDDGFVNGATNYFADDYENYSDVLTEIEALNANTSIKLKSEYAAQLQLIVNKLVARPSLVVTGAPNGKMLVSELVSYQMTATVDAGAKVVWKLNGTTVSETESYTYTPAAFGEEYKIEVTTTVGEKSKTLVYEGSILKATYTVNSAFTDGIKVEDNVININQTFAWGDQIGRKVVLSDLAFAGDVTVYFDLEFSSVVSTAVMGVFFLNANGDAIDNWAVVSGIDGFIEVATVDNADKKVRVPSATTTMNTTYHFKAVRSVVDGKGYLAIYMLDDNGNVIVTNTGNNIAKDYAGVVMIGIQAENCTGKISNISISNDTDIIDKSELTALVADANKLDVTDYTTAVQNAFNKALADAKEVISSTNITKADIDNAYKALEDAIADLTSENYAEVVKAEIGEDNESITYGKEVYLNDDYNNLAEIIEEIEALNADSSIVKNSEYAAEFAKIVAKLQPVLNITADDETILTAPVIVNAYEEITLTAESSGATFSWTIDGEDKGTGATLKFTPDHNGEYTVVVTADKDGKINTREVVISVHKINYTINTALTLDNVKVDNNVVEISQSYGWGDYEGKKVTLPDIAFYGDFDVTFNLEFTEHRGDAGNANVMALFFLNGNMDYQANWVAICQHSGKLEVARGGAGDQKPQTDLYTNPMVVNEDGSISAPEDDSKPGSYALNKFWTIKVERRVVDNKSILTAYVYDENNNLVAYNNADQGFSNTGAVRFGFQSENVSYKLSDFDVQFVNGYVTDRTVLGETVKQLNNLVLADYEETADFVAALLAARNAYTWNLTQEGYDEALANLVEEYDALVLKTVEKAEIAGSSFGYAGVSYEMAGYTNFLEVVGKITVLNSDATINTFTAYDEAIKEIIAQLVAKYEVTINGISEGNLIVNNLISYNLSAVVESEADDETVYTYEWSVNGKTVENADEATYEFTPEEYGEYTVMVIVSAEDGSSVSKVVNVSFIQSNFAVKANDGHNITVNNDNTITIGDDIAWGEWEGRNVVLDDLAFNGSFSVSVDVTLDKWWGNAGDANVVTIHLLNADTLSPNWGGDAARIAYGALCLHSKQLETGGGLSTRRSNENPAAGNEGVAEKVIAAASQFNQEGKTFTIKLTVLRNTARQYTLVMSLWDSENGEWIDFSRYTEWTGDFSGAFYVSHNVENAGVTLSNYRYELLAGTDTYVAGSVQSKVALRSALDEYVDVDYADYTNVNAFAKAYAAAKSEYNNNTITANYAKVVADLEAAYKALVEREAEVSTELDKGYTIIRGLDSITATGADVTAENVSWTYKFLAANADKDAVAEAKTVEGAALTLAAGKYTEVCLTVGETVIAYQDFTVENINLKSNNSEVVINEDGSVTVTNGAGWGPKEQLVINGVYTQNFEMTFDAKYTNHDGGFRVMCINLFGEDIRATFGWRRDEGDNRDNTYWLGFDNGGQWNTIPNTDAEDDAYDYIRDNAAKFGIKLSTTTLGSYSVTFTVYAADGSVISERTCTGSAFHIDTTTQIRFTFENVNVELDNFTVMYK